MRTFFSVTAHRPNEIGINGKKALACRIRVFLCSRFSRTVTTLTILACCALFSVNANASSCGGLANSGSAVASSQARFSQRLRATGVERKNSVDGVEDEDSGTIVGLWHVVLLLPDGSFFDEGFDQFHSDGTEILNDNPQPGPPNGAGSVCLGVYKRVNKEEGSRTYKLKHPFWRFDEKGILIGSGVIWQTIILDDAANYHGSFLLIAYDLEGVEIARAEGTLNGERFTVD